MQASFNQGAGFHPKYQKSSVTKRSQRTRHEEIHLHYSFFGLVFLAFGMYEYISELIFRNRAIKADAIIKYVKEEHVSIKTEGELLNCSYGYVDHVCRYTISFSLRDNQLIITKQVTSVGNPCLRAGSAVPIIYDHASPSDTVCKHNEGCIINFWLLEIIFQNILVCSSYLDLRKYKNHI